jgi:hypothetical protein
MAWRGPVSAAEPQAKAATAAAATKSPLERASCVLAVRGGFNGRELDIQAVSAALTSTGVVDPAAKEALGLDAATWPDVVNIELTPAGAQAVKLTVTVSPKGDAKLPPSPARKLMDAVVARVIKAFQTDVPARKAADERRQKLEARQAELQRELSAARAEVERVAVTARNAVDRTGPDPVSVWREDLQDKQVRLKALDATFAEVLKARQPQLDAAKGLLAAREALRGKLEAAAAKGQAADVDLAKAHEAVAEAKAQVAELSLNPAMDPKGRWFDTLVQMRMEVASLERRVAAAKDTPSPTTRPSRSELLAEQERLGRELAQKQSDLQLVANQLEQTRREAYPYQGQPEAKLVVLGAGDGE